MNKSNPYKFFDDIVCINIGSRVERRESTQNVFDQLNIPGRFHTVVKHPKGGRYGCFESHIQVIKEAYEKGHERILIFEDDIKVTPTYSRKQLETCINFMTMNEWDVFYLGYIITPNDYGSVYDFYKSKFINHHVIDFEPLAAHVYCVNRKGMKKILEQYESYIDTNHYDVFLLIIGLKIYSTIPILFSQEACFKSDNPLFEQSKEIPYRDLMCFNETNDIFCRMTHLKYNFNKHQRKYFTFIIVLHF